MKCKVCNGKGMVDDPMWADEAHTMQYLVARMKKCPACGGSGEIVQTNEEWLRQCNTEELAEFIRKQRDDWSDGWYSDCHRFEEIVEWLKEKHREQS